MMKHNIELGCALETGGLLVPCNESDDDGEHNNAVTDVYLCGLVQDKEQEGLRTGSIKVGMDQEQEGLRTCSIKVGMDQETGFVMEDVATVEQDGKASQEPGGAAERSGDMEECHEQQGSAEINGEGNLEHIVAAALSFVADLLVGTWAEDDPSVLHKSSKEITQPLADARELPEHLQDLFDRAKETLTPEQAAWVKEILLEFVNVFAETGFDIGQSTALFHYLKAGQEFPIKQSMQWTPLGFVKAGEGYVGTDAICQSDWT